MTEGPIGPGPVPPAAMRIPLLIRNRRFSLLLASFLFSQLPSHTITFVLLTRLFELTGTALAASVLWIAYALPSIILGPIAGAVVDVQDRRRMLAGINLARGAAVLVLALSGAMSMVLIYGIVLLTSALNQFYAPAEFSCLPALIPLEDLPGATSLLFIVQQAAVLVGFSLGGGLVALFGVPGTLGLSAAMIFAAFIFTLFLPSMKACPIERGEQGFGLMSRISAGYRFLAREQGVLEPFLLLLSGQAILSVIIVSVPAVAVELVRIPARAAGLVVVAPFALGALVCAVWLPRLLACGRRPRKVIEISLIVIALCLGLLISAVPVLRGWPRIALGGAISWGFGLAMIGLMVPSRTLVQARTPGGLQGRIFGGLSVVSSVVSVVPVMISGTAAHLFGIRLPLGVMGLFCLGGLTLSRKVSRFFRSREGVTDTC